MFDCSAPVGLIAQHELVLDHARGAFEQLMRLIQERQHSQITRKVVERSMEKCLPADGEIIEPAHIAALSETVAEDFTRHLFRINSETPIDVQNFLASDDKDNSE